MASSSKRAKLDSMPNWKDGVYAKGVGKRAFISRKIQEQKKREDEDDGFMLFDLGDVYKQHRRWTKAMRRVTPFLAVKCNPDETVLRLLSALNCGFDCASKGELQLLRETIGVDPDRIINANTWKQESHIKYAKKKGVKMMTFDCEEELDKVARVHPEAELVLRLSIYDETADFPFGIKFGCKTENAKVLLKKAKKLGLKIVGVSFHIGSGSRKPEIFELAIGEARKVFDEGANYGFKMDLLDIGGGFPGKKNLGPDDIEFEVSENTFGASAPNWSNFEVSYYFSKLKSISRFCDFHIGFADAVNKGLETYFPDESAVNVIAEPGRFFNESAGTLVANVYGKRRKTHPDDKHTDEKPGLQGRKLKGYDYFVNNGIFSSFARNLIDYGDVLPTPVDEKKLKKPKYPTTVYGNTCAEMDYCNEECELPELNIGDWIYYEDIGAYHCMNSGTFNGFQAPVKFNYALPSKLLSFVEQLQDEKAHPEGPPWQARAKGIKAKGATKGAVKKFVSLAPEDDKDIFTLNDN